MEGIGEHLPASCMHAAAAQDNDATGVQSGAPEGIALFAILLSAFCLAGILLTTWIKQKEAASAAAMKQARLDGLNRSAQELRFKQKVFRPSQPTTLVPDVPSRVPTPYPERGSADGSEMEMSCMASCARYFYLKGSVPTSDRPPHTHPRCGRWCRMKPRREAPRGCRRGSGARQAAAPPRASPLRCALGCLQGGPDSGGVQPCAARRRGRAPSWSSARTLPPRGTCQNWSCCSVRGARPPWRRHSGKRHLPKMDTPLECHLMQVAF